MGRTRGAHEVGCHLPTRPQLCRRQACIPDGVHQDADIGIVGGVVSCAEARLFAFFNVGAVLQTLSFVPWRMLERLVEAPSCLSVRLFTAVSDVTV